MTLLAALMALFFYFFLWSMSANRYSQSKVALHNYTLKADLKKIYENILCSLENEIYFDKKWYNSNFNNLFIMLAQSLFSSVTISLILELSNNISP